MGKYLIQGSKEELGLPEDIDERIGYGTRRMDV